MHTMQLRRLKVRLNLQRDLWEREREREREVRWDVVIFGQFPDLSV